MDYKSKIREMVKEELLKFLEEEETLEEETLEEEAVDEEEEKLSAFQKALRRRQAMSDAYDKRKGVKRSPTTKYSIGGGPTKTKPNPSYKPDA